MRPLDRSAPVSCVCVNNNKLKTKMSRAFRSSMSLHTSTSRFSWGSHVSYFVPQCRPFPSCASGVYVWFYVVPNADFDQTNLFNPSCRVDGTLTEVCDAREMHTFSYDILQVDTWQSKYRLRSFWSRILRYTRTYRIPNFYPPQKSPQKRPNMAVWPPLDPPTHAHGQLLSITNTPDTGTDSATCLSSSPPHSMGWDVQRTVAENRVWTHFAHGNPKTRSSTLMELHQIHRQGVVWCTLCFVCIFSWRYAKKHESGDVVRRTAGRWWLSAQSLRQSQVNVRPKRLEKGLGQRRRW